MKLTIHLITLYDKSEEYQKIIELTQMVTNQLNDYQINSDLEVQERAASAVYLIIIIEKHFNKLITENQDQSNPKTDEHVTFVTELSNLFKGELIPVAPKAQRKVPIPDG